MQETIRAIPNDTQDSNCLFAQCLYRAKSKQEFFQLYADELMKLYQASNDTNALVKAGFVKYYASQISNPKFLRASKQVYAQLQKLVTELDPNLIDDVEGRCKAIESTINKADLYIDRLSDINDIFAFRVVLDGPFTEEELVSFCYKFLDKACKHYLSNGYILCRASPVSNTLDPNSEDWKKVVHPTEEDLKRISWISPRQKKDYIATPKSNMYQSLHVAFISPDGFVFELQIRTLRMHCRAEEGDIDKGANDTLSHYHYKEGKYPNGVSYDPRKVTGIPGFIVVEDPESGKLIIYDNIGLTVPLKIISGI